MKRPYLNKAGFNKLAQSIKDYVNRKITGYDKLGTASTKDFTTYVSPTQTEQLPISSSVYSAMTNMLRGAYHPAGSKTVAELTEDLLVKANLGNVYKITEDGVTSDLFIGGAGQTIKTGDNAIVLYASEDTYKFSLESGVVDLDAYQKKELTSGALIEDVIPSNASASNKLVTEDVIPADASASNKLVTEDNKGVGKSIARSLSSAGWYKICESGSRNQGTGFQINLGSVFNSNTSCMHIINFSYGYTSGHMSELARDGEPIFDKIRFVYVSNLERNIVLVHYRMSQLNRCYATISSSYNSNNLNVFNFEAVDETQYTNYVEYKLGTNGMYENGQKLVTESDVPIKTTTTFDSNTSISRIFTLPSHNDGDRYKISFSAQQYNSPSSYYGEWGISFAGTGITQVEIVRRGSVSISYDASTYTLTFETDSQSSFGSIICEKIH